MNKKLPSENDLNRLLDKLAECACSPKEDFSAEKSYEMFRRRIPRKTTLPVLFRYVSTAAAIFIVILISAQLYLYISASDMVTLTTTDQIKEIVLPDGSTVKLNRYSSLTYPEKFKDVAREVILSGEGYFEVISDKENPFIVQTDDIEVKAVGTIFNVYAYPGSQEVKTTLLKGSVEVSGVNTSASIRLEQDQTAIFNKQTATFYSETINSTENNIAWLSGSLIFNDTPLEEIARELSNYFNTEIRIEDAALKSYKLTARFEKGESLNEILSLLQAAGNFTYQTKDKAIVIKLKK